MTAAKLNSILKNLYEAEQAADAEADRCESECGEFSKPHSFWIDARTSLRNAIEQLNGDMNRRDCRKFYAAFGLDPTICQGR